MKSKGIDLKAMSQNLAPQIIGQLNPPPPGGPPEQITPSEIPPTQQRQLIADRQGPIQKALIIFGSPRGKKGHTFRMLNHFISGLEQSGVEVELIDLHAHTIRPCTGCFSCWTKTPGVCIHQDDMAGLLQKLDRAECVVYAQPLYTFSVPGIMKNFLDRCLPRLEPYLIKGPDNTSRHPRRWSQNGRMVLFSVCGFPEIEHFDALRRMYRLLAQASGTHLVGEILRPGSESLQFADQMPQAIARIEEATVEAGRQIGTLGYIQQETEHTISHPLATSQEGFHTVANEFWDSWIRFEAEKRRGTTDLELPEYLAIQPGILFKGMASTFDHKAAADFQGTFQFNLQDGSKNRYVIRIKNGRCTASDGTAPHADVTINTPFNVWQSIARGEISGQEALSKGLYSVEGDISYLLQFNTIFSSHKEA